MESILTDLFNGKIAPFENLTPNDPEFPSLKQKYLEEKAYFNSKLSEDDLIRHDNLDEMDDIISNMENTEAFIRGFRLASKIMAEVFGGDNELPDILKILSVDKSGK